MPGELRDLLEGGGMGEMDEMGAMGGMVDLGPEDEFDPSVLEQDQPTRSPDDPGVSMDELRVILKASLDQAVDYCEEELA